MALINRDDILFPLLFFRAPGNVNIKMNIAIILTVVDLRRAT